MGIVIEINDNIITVRFEDGSCRKYLKENFIREPFLNQKVQLNVDGTLIDLNEKNKKTKKYTIILTCFLVVVIVLLGIGFVSCAVNVGKEINSCVTNCPG